MSVKEEEDNEHDIFAVSFEKAGMIVGPVPHEVSTRHGGSIVCDWPQKTAWIDHATIWEGPLCTRALNKKRF